jgi:hypothetical protein
MLGRSPVGPQSQTMSGKGAIIGIGAWRRGHGLGQYEATFCQNEIDHVILPALTESHLPSQSVVLILDTVCVTPAARVGAAEGSAAEKQRAFAFHAVGLGWNIGAHPPRTLCHHPRARGPGSQPNCRDHWSRLSCGNGLGAPVPPLWRDTLSPLRSFEWV